MKLLLAIALTSSALLIKQLPSLAVSVTLYDGSQGTTPGAQGELQPGAIRNFLGNPFPVPIGETLVPGGVQVDTDVNSAEYSGYSNYNPQTGFVGSSYTLDQALGYSVFFEFSLDSTTSNSPNRAAFSVTVTGQNNQSIELAFENNLIFGQNSNFTPGVDQVQFNTASNTGYELRVLNNGYELFANDNLILSGLLRTYDFNPATSDPPLGTFNPYQTPNFIFFGDNTGQEQGVFTLRGAAVQTNNANPVPFEFSPTLGLVALAGLWGVERCWKRWQH